MARTKERETKRTSKEPKQQLVKRRRMPDVLAIPDKASYSSDEEMTLEEQEAILKAALDEKTALEWDKIWNTIPKDKQYIEKLDSTSVTERARVENGQPPTSREADEDEREYEVHAILERHELTNGWIVYVVEWSCGKITMELEKNLNGCPRKLAECLARIGWEPHQYPNEAKDWANGASDTGFCVKDCLQYMLPEYDWTSIRPWLNTTEIHNELRKRHLTWNPLLCHEKKTLGTRSSGKLLAVKIEHCTVLDCDRQLEIDGDFEREWNGEVEVAWIIYEIKRANVSLNPNKRKRQ